ncbi:MAG: tRNA (guanosine(46)-N7)-methyltransferase TrmB [Rhizobiaceae bacterium]
MSGKPTRTQQRHRRSEAFFGRRKAKALSKEQERRFAELMPGLGIDPSLPSLKNLEEFFPGNPDQITLEIGFGGAEHLLHQAQSFPQQGFIGVEPFVNSMAKALRGIEEKSLQNIRLYDEDAVELLDWLPEESVDRIDLLYPDPWPKLRHWKRRFVNHKNLDRIARVLKRGGRFHFVSDIETYVNWTLQHCYHHPRFEWLAENSNDWHSPYDNWVRTRYEAKAIREKRQPCYLRFERS